jgi:hypothetical protein
MDNRRVEEVIRSKRFAEESAAPPQLHKNLNMLEES